jgi:hypothetical protein
LACRRRSPNEGRCVRQRRGGRSHSPEKRREAFGPPPMVVG